MTHHNDNRDEFIKQLIIVAFGLVSRFFYDLLKKIFDYTKRINKDTKSKVDDSNPGC